MAECSFSSMSDSEYWFCLKHHTRRGRRRLPQPSTGSAPTPRPRRRRALEKVQERNEEWDNDPEWNDDGPGSVDGLLMAPSTGPRTADVGYFFDFFLFLFFLPLAAALFA